MAVLGGAVVSQSFVSPVFGQSPGRLEIGAGLARRGVGYDPSAIAWGGTAHVGWLFSSPSSFAAHLGIAVSGFPQQKVVLVGASAKTASSPSPLAPGQMVTLGTSLDAFWYAKANKIGPYIGVGTGLSMLANSRVTQWHGLLSGSIGTNRRIGSSSVVFVEAQYEYTGARTGPRWLLPIFIGIGKTLGAPER